MKSVVENPTENNKADEDEDEKSGISCNKTQEEAELKSAFKKAVYLYQDYRQNPEST